MDSIDPFNTGEVILYQPDETMQLDVRLANDTVWLTQAQISELFQKERSGITKHISNIFKEGELEENSNVSFFHIANSDKPVKYYSLDVIISVGYRVKSLRGTQFRIWANNVLKQYLLRGFSINQHLVAMQQQIDTRFSKLEQTVEHQQQQLDLIIRTTEKPTEYVIPTGCEWDGYTYLSELIRSATKRIVLIDNFVDERTLLLLEKRQLEVTCTVHTRYNEKTNLDFEKHNKQCREIQKVQLPQAVHDRFLIIDEEVWLLGSSVKDMGHSLCSIIKMSITPDQVLTLLK